MSPRRHVEDLVIVVERVRGIEARVLVRDHRAPPREGLRLPERLLRAKDLVSWGWLQGSHPGGVGRGGARAKVGVRVRIGLGVG